MGLATRIRARVTGAGSRIINTYLQQWQLTDASGDETDQITLTVAAPDMDSMPPEGEVIGFQLGTSDGINTQWFERGKFIITRITPKLFPHIFTIVATAAPFQVNDQTAFRLRRSQTYSGTVGEIFRTVVNRHGLSPRIDEALDSLHIEHIDQTDETDMAFLTRLAKRYDAVAKPVENLYVMARRGNVKSLSKKEIAPIVIDIPINNQPTAHSFSNASVTNPSRHKFTGVKASWWDDEKGEEMIATVGDAPYKRLVQLYSNQDEAKQQAENELRKIQRTRMQIQLDVPANPKFHAEGIVTTSSRFPKYMQGDWSLDKVTMSGSKSGARAQLCATLTQNGSAPAGA